MTTALWVAAGGALGATARYGAVLAAARLFGAGFPVGTLVVNILGSLAIGVLAAWLLARPGGDPRWAAFLITGVLGGFTTFSAFALDVIALVERDRAVAAALYVGGSVAASVLAAAFGLWMARSVLS